VCTLYILSTPEGCPTLPLVHVLAVKFGDFVLSLIRTLDIHQCLCESVLVVYATIYPLSAQNTDGPAVFVKSVRNNL
jgi:hypothetical protein